jgi:hypothetical protein
MSAAESRYELLRVEIVRLDEAVAGDDQVDKTDANACELKESLHRSRDRYTSRIVVPAVAAPRCAATPARRHRASLVVMLTWMSAE